MIIKEIAELTGKTEKTIREWIAQEQKVLTQEQKVLTKGHAQDYDLQTVIAILRSGKVSEKLIALLVQNATQNATLTEANAIVDNRFNRLETMVEKLISSIPLIVAETVKAINNNQSNQIEDKREFFTIKAWIAKNRLKARPDSEMKLLGFKARKISKELGKEISKTDDEKWGEVNVYHISVLEKVFAIDEEEGI